MHGAKLKLAAKNTSWKDNTKCELTFKIKEHKNLKTL